MALDKGHWSKFISTTPIDWRCDAHNGLRRWMTTLQPRWHNTVADMRWMVILNWHGPWKEVADYKGLGHRVLRNVQNRLKLGNNKFRSNLPIFNEWLKKNRGVHPTLPIQVRRLNRVFCDRGAKRYSPPCYFLMAPIWTLFCRDETDVT